MRELPNMNIAATVLRCEVGGGDGGGRKSECGGSKRGGEVGEE